MITHFPTELYITPLVNGKSMPFILRQYSGSDKCIEDGFYPSSISYTMDKTTKDEYLIVRMINYRLSNDGRQYIYSNNEQIIENKNILINLTTQQSIPLTISTDNGFNEFPTTFSKGLEDIRIYPDMTFSANSVSFTGGKVPQIVHGSINTLKGCMYDCVHIGSPFGEYQCEKNWIFIEQGTTKKILYRWDPFEIGIIEDTHTYLKIESSYHLMPAYIFKNMRGSTPFYPYHRNISISYPLSTISTEYNDDWLIGVVHYSIDQPYYAPIARKYFHCLVLLNPNTCMPQFITHPFTFSQEATIEFCIGMRFNPCDSIFTFWVSIMDGTPIEYSIHEDNIHFSIPIHKM
jgi:hypothetical protein